MTGIPGPKYPVRSANRDTAYAGQRGATEKIDLNDMEVVEAIASMYSIRADAVLENTTVQQQTCFSRDASLPMIIVLLTHRYLRVVKGSKLSQKVVFSISPHGKSTKLGILVLLSCTCKHSFVKTEPVMESAIYSICW